MTIKKLGVYSLKKNYAMKLYIKDHTRKNVM